MFSHESTPSHATRLRIVGSAALLGLLLLAGFIGPGTAQAAPPEPGNASCMGYEASAVSPPGSNEEAPGGMPNVLADVDAFFVETGAFKNRGAVISFFTKLGAGSHEPCDEALLEAVFGGG
jgi:hypothetical protein